MSQYLYTPRAVPEKEAIVGWLRVVKGNDYDALLRELGARNATRQSEIKELATLRARVAALEAAGEEFTNKVRASWKFLSRCETMEEMRAFAYSAMKEYATASDAKTE